MRKKCGKKLPTNINKIFENGTSSYYIINHVNGSAKQMLEHFLDLLRVDENYLMNKEFTDTLELSHPDFLEGISITGAPGNNTSLYFYFITTNL